MVGVLFVVLICVNQPTSVSTPRGLNSNSISTGKIMKLIAYILLIALSLPIVGNCGIRKVVSGVSDGEQELAIGLATYIGNSPTVISSKDPMDMMLGISSGRYDLAIIQEDAVKLYEQENSHLKVTWRILTRLYYKPIFIAYVCHGDITSELGLIDSEAVVGLDNLDRYAKATWDYMSGLYDSVSGVTTKEMPIPDGVKALRNQEINALMWIDGKGSMQYVDADPKLCIKGLKDPDLLESGIYKRDWVEYKGDRALWEPKEVVRTTKVPVVLLLGRFVDKGERTKLSKLINQLVRGRDTCPALGGD